MSRSMLERLIAESFVHGMVHSFVQVAKRRKTQWKGNEVTYLLILESFECVDLLQKLILVTILGMPSR